MNVICNTVAVSSALTDDDDDEYLHASISGMRNTYFKLQIYSSVCSNTRSHYMLNGDAA